MHSSLGDQIQARFYINVIRGFERNFARLQNDAILQMETNYNYVVIEPSRIQNF